MLDLTFGQLLCLGVVALIDILVILYFHRHAWDGFLPPDDK